MSDEKKYKKNNNNIEDKIPGNPINGDNKKEYNSNKSKGKKKFSTQKIKDLIKYFRNRTFGEKRDIILIFTNIILALGSIASVILIYCMTSKQNDISGKLLNAQLKRDSIDNVKDSLLRKRENDFFFVANRANVSIEVIKLTYEPDQECTIEWQKMNSGATTAFNTRQNVSRLMHPMTKDEFIEYTKILAYRGANIGAKESHNRISHLGIVSQKEYNATINGLFEPHFFILVCYETLDSNRVVYLNFRYDIKKNSILEVQEYTGGN